MSHLLDKTKKVTVVGGNDIGKRGTIGRTKERKDDRRYKTIGASGLEFLKRVRAVPVDVVALRHIVSYSK